MTTFYWIALLIFSHMIHAVISFAFNRYNKNVVIPVAKEQGPYSPEWKDFIIASINSCRHPQQCLIVQKMIWLYREMFKNKVPKKVLYDIIESLTNRLDTKYKSLKKEDKLSELTIEDFIN